MGRFDLIEREINKGISVDEKSNTVIPNWSPNNVRRLVIGFEFALVQYYVTGGKYGRLIELVDLRQVCKKDMELLSVDPKRYRPILKVLTSGRVCSSIEEIIFVAQGYPEYLLSLDCNPQTIQGSTTIESRFKRLRGITIVDADIRKIADLMKETKKSDELLIDTINDFNIQNRVVISKAETDWWSHTSLRPHVYPMDNQSLKDYFDKLKEAQLAKIREKELASANFDRNSTLLKNHLPQINSLVSQTMKLLEQSEEVFKNAPILSKAEWAKELHIRNVYKAIRKELVRNKEQIIEFRKIDFDALQGVADIITSNNENQESRPQTQNSISKLRELVFTDILPNEDEYKLDSNKASFSDSVTSIRKLASKVFNTQVNIVFLSFIKYLTRNTPEYVDFFFSRLPNQLNDLNYTRTVVEFCNKYTEDGWSKQAFTKIEATELLTEEYTFKLKSNDSNRILTSLATVN